MNVYYNGRSYNLNNEEDKAAYNEVMAERKAASAEKDNKALLDGLIEKANKGEHSKFEYLTNMDAAFGAATVLKALRLTVKGFKKSSKKLFKQYIKTGSYSYLLAYKQMKDFCIFYTVEIYTLKEMCSEFLAYAIRHIKFLAEGNERPKEDCKDWRNPANRA